MKKYIIISLSGTGHTLCPASCSPYLYSLEQVSALPSTRLEGLLVPSSLIFNNYYNMYKTLYYDDDDDRECIRSDALSVDDGSTVLVVVLLGDPHARESGQGGKGGTTSPDGESSVGPGQDLHSNCFWGSGLDLLE